MLHNYLLEVLIADCMDFHDEVEKNPYLLPAYWHSDRVEGLAVLLDSGEIALPGLKNLIHADQITEIKVKKGRCRCDKCGGDLETEERMNLGSEGG